MFAEDATLPLHPEVWAGPKPELLLLTFEEHFSHPAEQMQTVLAGKGGCARQLRHGCSQHTRVRVAAGIRAPFPCSHPAHGAAETPGATRGQQSRGLGQGPGSPWSTEYS